MKAVYFSSFGGPEVLQAGELPEPRPESDKLIIQIKAVSINPVDYKIRRGNLKLMTGSKFPQIPCCDFAGIVRDSVPENTGFNPCDKVYGYIPTMLRKPGALAELAVASPRHVSLVPEGMVFEEAASLPVACLTALNGLRRGGDLTGKTILINGATGGVGHFAVQIARSKGAIVTGICSTRNHDLAKKLGCEDAFDYADAGLAVMNKKFDMIFDAWGKMNVQESYRLLKQNGIYATTQLNPLNLVSSFLGSLVSGKKMTSASLRTRTKDFEEMELLFKKGLIRPYVEHTFTLNEAADAFRFAESGKHRGKVVIRI